MSIVHHFNGNQSNGNYMWEDVQPLEINLQEVQGVMKHVLIGPNDDAPNFIIRYFQVPINGCTFYHKHPHEHGMLILHGYAKININEEFFDLSPLDVVFVSGDDLHQIINVGDSPLGFICTIPQLEKKE